MIYQMVRMCRFGLPGLPVSTGRLRNDSADNRRATVAVVHVQDLNLLCVELSSNALAIGFNK